MPQQRRIASKIPFLSSLIKAARYHAIRKEYGLGRPADTLRHRPSTRPFADSLGTHLYPLATWRGLLWEIRSFFLRMQFVLGTRIYQRLVTVSAGQLGQGWRECQRIQNACIEDINKLSAVRPWLTLVDTESTSQAWMMGATWYAHNYANLSRSALASEPSSSSNPQYSNRDSDQTSAEMPAAIAGVTRKD